MLLQGKQQPMVSDCRDACRSEPDGEQQQLQEEAVQPAASAEVQNASQPEQPAAALPAAADDHTPEAAAADGNAEITELDQLTGGKEQAASEESQLQMDSQQEQQQADEVHRPDLQLPEELQQPVEHNLRLLLGYVPIEYAHCRYFTCSHTD